MKMIYLIKWLLAIGVVALLFGFQLIFPMFPKELIPILSLATILIILKIFQAYEK